MCYNICKLATQNAPQNHFLSLRRVGRSFVAVHGNCGGFALPGISEFATRRLLLPAPYYTQILLH
jgi:hypothetical protein